MPTENGMDNFLSGYEQFFQNYRPKTISTDEHFKEWQGKTPQGSIEDYIMHCFSEAFQYMAKHAPDEATGYQWKLELDTKLWEFRRAQQSTDTNYYLQQMHIDKVLLSKHTLPFAFDIVIDSKECCNSCSKHHLKQVTLESILKGKHLPYKNCKREDYCICTYAIVPKNSANG